jgi:hypothetical protein
LSSSTVAAALVDSDHVRHAGKDAETLHDGGFDRPAVAAVRRMEGEHVWRPAQPQVLKDGALDGLL